MIHRVVVYLKGNSIAHVQSTNGPTWPRLIVETDAAHVEVPLRRIELELEPTRAEIDDGEHGQPRHRNAGVLLRDELEYDAASRQVRYRSGRGLTGKIDLRTRL